jgi:type VI protein secretion system component VasK
VDQGIMTLITVGLVLAAAVFTMWLLYSVIWRAVRRGMQEFAIARWEREEQHEREPEAQAVAVHHRHLHMPVRRRVPDDTDPSDVVPDFPPSEWF